MDICPKCHLAENAKKDCPACMEVRRAIWAGEVMRMSIESAEEWAEGIASAMESKAAEVREYAKRMNQTGNTKPEDLMGFIINIVSNMNNNLNMNSAPRIAAKIAEARALHLNKGSF